MKYHSNIYLGNLFLTLQAEKAVCSSFYRKICKAIKDNLILLIARDAYYQLIMKRFLILLTI